MKKGNLLWGLFFVIAAVLVILNQAGMLAGLNLINIIISLLLVPVIIYSAIKVNFWGICFPLAILAILYDDILGIEAFTPWTVLLSALLMSIGLSLLFPPRKKDIYQNPNGGQAVQGNAAAWERYTVYDNFVRIRTIFRSTVRCIGSRNLQGVEITSSFSSVRLYFNNATITSGQAVVNLNSRFSGIELYVPRTWQVVNSAQCTVSGIEEKGFTNFAKANSALVIRGTAQFSGITVIYV